MHTPLVFHDGEGTQIHYGANFLMKLGERTHGRGIAIVQYTTCHGEEPPEHTHDTEDEIFYILKGVIRFVIVERTYTLAAGGMIILPCGIPHTYAIDDGQEVSLLVITYPVQDTPNGWGGFVADMESTIVY
ncbi:MAG: hypothetical protein RLY87_156 [Chloroflexota bacterium]